MAEVSGLLLLDKPAGLTSSDLVVRARKKFAIKRVGHAGTLDPMATGLMLLLVGKATRLQDFLLLEEKAYRGLIRLGVATDTDDLEGTVIQEDPTCRFEDEQEQELIIEQLTRVFSGEQQQVPPQYSAIHVGGKRSYEIARKGEAVEHAARKVVFHHTNFTFTSPDTLAYDITCSKGTYIRSLARDIGRELGSCASLAEIRRTKSGAFDIADALPLEEIDREMLKARLIPMDKLARRFPVVEVDSSDSEKLRCGIQSPLERLEELGNEGFAALFGPEGFLGLAERVGVSETARWKVRFLMAGD